MSSSKSVREWIDVLSISADESEVHVSHAKIGLLLRRHEFLHVASHPIQGVEAQMELIASSDFAPDDSVAQAELISIVPESSYSEELTSAIHSANVHSRIVRIVPIRLLMKILSKADASDVLIAILPDTSIELSLLGANCYLRGCWKTPTDTLYVPPWYRPRRKPASPPRTGCDAPTRRSSPVSDVGLQKPKPPPLNRL